MNKIKAFMSGFLLHFLFLACVLTVGLAPPEQLLGYTQKIMYFHVASAVGCFFLLAVGFLVAVSKFLGLFPSGEKFCSVVIRLSFLLASFVLLSGMIWARYAWGAWFHFEPRLVSFLILWIFLLSANFFEDYRHFSPLVCVFGFVLAGLAKYSIEFANPQFQLHPQVLAQGGLKHPMFEVALYSTIAFVLILSFKLISLGLKVEALKDILKH